MPYWYINNFFSDHGKHNLMPKIYKHNMNHACRQYYAVVHENIFSFTSWFSKMNRIDLRSLATT